MAYGDDVTQDLPFNLSNPGASNVYQLTGESYDLSINGLPFYIFSTDETPYRRETAPYRKQQIDQTSEPGEQTLTGWWLRSQSSFHSGMGINYYDPSAGETVAYRINDSENVDVWTKGQVTLLKETANMSGVTSGVYNILSIMDDTTPKILGWTPANTTINNYTAAGTSTTYTSVVTAGLDTATLAIASNGTRLFIADNDSIYTGLINSPTSGYTQYYRSFSSEKIVLGWVKQRLVGCVGVSVYELTNDLASDHALPTALYTHPNSDWIWTSIAEGGSAIYISGYAAGKSTIYKFALSTAGAMPTLTSAITAAEFPTGEVVHKIESYLGYLVIGTSKGVRVAEIQDDGSLIYGPLIIETANPVLDFAFRDRFCWATGSVNGHPGLYRIDLGNEITPLRFAWANDAFLDGASGYATSVDFVGNTDQIAFTTSGSNGIAIQSTTTLAETGYLTTGRIRYNTLEAKLFKLLTVRLDNTYGELTVRSISPNDATYSIGGFAEGASISDLSISYPPGAQEYLSFKFNFKRSNTTSKGPILKGYQVKALPALPRQRLIQYPLACYDNEKDKFNVSSGYEGSAYNRLAALEAVENTGDSIRIEDFRTGESYVGLIEGIQFVNRTPPDKRFSGFGGVLYVTIRSL